MWIIGVLVCLLVAVIADHWIPGGLGPVGRVLASLVLVGGSVWYIAMRIVPLVIRGINPTYAARTIEEATPSLKNSLSTSCFSGRTAAACARLCFRRSRPRRRLISRSFPSNRPSIAAG